MERGGIRAGRDERWLGRAERVRDAFGLVLGLVLTTYVLTSLLDNHGWTAVVLVLATGLTSVVALTSSHVEPRYVRAAVLLSGLSILLAAIAAISDEHTWLNFSSAVQIGMLTVAMGAVLIRVITTAEVGSRTILGAISVYTVLGLIFTFLYALIDRVQTAPFFEANAHPGSNDFLFFSYTTLTTTGYGNLVPSGQPGRMLAGIEMMIGQIFLVTLVAGLVSLWRPGEKLRKRREAKGEAGTAETAAEPPS